MTNDIDLPPIYLGLGGWTGLDPKEQEAARGWFLTGLQVSCRISCLRLLKLTPNMTDWVQTRRRSAHLR